MRLAGLPDAGAAAAAASAAASAASARRSEGTLARSLRPRACSLSRTPFSTFRRVQWPCGQQKSISHVPSHTAGQVPGVWPNACRRAQGLDALQRCISKVSVTAKSLHGFRQPHRRTSSETCLGCHARGACSRWEGDRSASAHPVCQQRPAVLGPQALIRPDLAQHGVALLQGAASGSARLGRWRSLRFFAALRSAPLRHDLCKRHQALPP